MIERSRSDTYIQLSNLRAWLTWIVLGLLITFGVAAWALIVAYLFDANNPKFVGVSLYFEEPEPLESDIDLRTLNVGCTNNTFGDDVHKYRGKTYFGYKCPALENVCLENICGSNGQCQEALIEGATCSNDFECNNSTTNLFRCDIDTCTCVANEFECSSDSDCLTYSTSACQTISCVAGSCVQNTTSGEECGTTQDCASGLVCDSTCSCIIPDNSITTAEFTPNITAVGTDLDYANSVNISGLYTILNNYIELQVTFRVLGAADNSTDMDFQFTLPVVAVADTTAVNIGSVLVIPESSISGFPTSTLAGNGHVELVSGTTALADLSNINPSYTGPTIVEDFYRIVLTFKYKLS